MNKYYIIIKNKCLAKTLKQKLCNLIYLCYLLFIYRYLFLWMFLTRIRLDFENKGKQNRPNLMKLRMFGKILWNYFTS